MEREEGLGWEARVRVERGEWDGRGRGECDRGGREGEWWRRDGSERAVEREEGLGRKAQRVGERKVG